MSASVYNGAHYAYRAGRTNEFVESTTMYSSTSKLSCVVFASALTGMSRFVQLVRKHYPHSLLHFEDFGVTNAYRLLQKYRDAHAVFNDDV